MINLYNKESRVFIAIDLSKELRENINKLKERFSADQVRFISTDAIHITLFFLGNLEEQKIIEVKSVLQDFKYKDFNLSIEGIGTFSAKNPSVVFAKVKNGEKELMEIYKLLYQKIKMLNIKMETRAYSPHITIARVSSSNIELDSKISKFVEENSTQEFGNFNCNAIKLKESILKSSGAVYSDLYLKELERAA